MEKDRVVFDQSNNNQLALRKDRIVPIASLIIIIFNRKSKTVITLFQFKEYYFSKEKTLLSMKKNGNIHIVFSNIWNNKIKLTL